MSNQRKRKAQASANAQFEATRYPAKANDTKDVKTDTTKELLDCLKNDNAEGVRAHLAATPTWMDHNTTRPLELVSLISTHKAFACFDEVLNFVTTKQKRDLVSFVRDTCFQSPLPLDAIYHVLHWCGFRIVAATDGTAPVPSHPTKPKTLVTFEGTIPVNQIVIPKMPELGTGTPQELEKWKVLAILMTMMPWIQCSQHKSNTNWIHSLRSVYTVLQNCLDAREQHSKSEKMPYWSTDPWVLLDEPLTWRMLMNPGGPFFVQPSKTALWKLCQAQEFDILKTILTIMKTNDLSLDETQHELDDEFFMNPKLRAPSLEMDAFVMGLVEMFDGEYMWCDGVHAFEYFSQRPHVVARVLKFAPKWILVYHLNNRAINPCDRFVYQRAFLRVLNVVVTERRKLANPQTKDDETALVRQHLEGVKFCSPMDDESFASHVMEIINQPFGSVCIKQSALYKRDDKPCGFQRNGGNETGSESEDSEDSEDSDDSDDSDDGEDSDGSSSNSDTDAEMVDDESEDDDESEESDDE